MSFDLEDKTKWDELAPSLQALLKKMREDIDKLRVDLDNLVQVVAQLRQEFDTHNHDNVRHITQAERDKWNSAAGSGGDSGPVTPTTMLLKGGIEVATYGCDYHWGDDVSNKAIWTYSFTVFGTNSLKVSMFFAFEYDYPGVLGNVVTVSFACPYPIEYHPNQVNKWSMAGESEFKTVYNSNWVYISNQRLLSSIESHPYAQNTMGFDIVQKNHSDNHISVWGTIIGGITVGKVLNYDGDYSYNAIKNLPPSGYQLIDDASWLYNFSTRHITSRN